MPVFATLSQRLIPPVLEAIPREEEEVQIMNSANVRWL